MASVDGTERPPFLAKDLMTREVVSVRPNTPMREIERLLAALAICAVPVVDGGGAPIGMVCEGDLFGRDDATRRARRDWWLTMLAEGENLAPEFLASLRPADHKAKDVMTAPVVTVTETTDAVEVARLLTTYRIKRVPVVRDGCVVGIVSRADLLRAVAAPPGVVPQASGGFLSRAVQSIHRHFVEGEREEAAPASAPPASAEKTNFDADDFRELVADFGHERARKQAQKRAAAASARRTRVKDLIDHHISDQAWRALLHKARMAAERGEKEFLLLQFPAQLCSDGGRAINVPDSTWPATLRGEAAEIYLRWERELKPRGFHLSAHILDFPGGLPGDVAMFLVWGG
jgi:CBS domain-containing protein